jgi:putative ABC transport system permease protein
MASADPRVAARRRPFPALEPESPRRRWQPWRRAVPALVRTAIVVASCLRGLAHRVGAAATILVVAVVATGAAAAGPVYYLASQHSILTGSLAGAGVPFLSRGYEATLSGPVAGTLPTLEGLVYPEQELDLGTRLFRRPVESIEGTFVDPEQETFPLVWRTDFCSHLVITGSCPVEPDQVIVSASDIKRAGWHIGTRIRGAGWPKMTITGIYRPPGSATRNTDYWVLRAAAYFPEQMQASAGSLNGPQTAGFDAAFTSVSTMNYAPASAQGSVYIDDAVRPSRITIGNVPAIQKNVATFESSQAMVEASVNVVTSLPATMAADQAAWQGVAVPATLATLMLLLLTWLLLFLLVTDAVEARGLEIALAKLHGHRRAGVLIFGLSEPAVVLLVALPAGALAGRVVAAQLVRIEMVPGTPIEMPWHAWAAAAFAVAGGLAAVALAAQRVLRRGVVEQFRRPSRLVAGRGWVFDSILLTGSVAGLIEVLSTGQIGPASHSLLDLLTPGLLGLAVAVVASRLLPLGCRALYGAGARLGGLAAYLALRHIARRTGGVRTTIVLATAFSLAAFALAAWTVGQRNYRLVASANLGASEVLTVSAPAGRDLGAIVDKADPSGRLATAVDTYGNTIAIDPARFDRIADWPGSLSAIQIAKITSALHPPAAPPVVLTGDAMRVTVDVTSMSMADGQLSANVTTGASPVLLGTLPRHGPATLTGSLTDCPCVLDSFALNFPGQQEAFGQSKSTASGRLTFSAIDIRDHGRWVPAAPASVLRTASFWRDETVGLGPNVPLPTISVGNQGLTWSISREPGNSAPTLGAANVPVPLPAITASATGAPAGRFTGNGLDGNSLPMYRVHGPSVPWIPSMPTDGLLVDRAYAELAAGYNLAQANEQVWLAAGALPVIRPKLIASHVRILSAHSIASVTARLSRQGPALASSLFLVDAGAAALLAAGSAILGLYASARRRRYEYAALLASGVRRRALRAAVLIELAAVLGFGTLTGVATGLAAARLVLSSVPEFSRVPTAPVLSYIPPAGPLAVWLGIAGALLILAAVLASIRLINAVSADLLREDPA